jgi:hypothetical protein
VELLPAWLRYLLGLPAAGIQEICYCKLALLLPESLDQSALLRVQLRLAKQARYLCKLETAERVLAVTFPSHLAQVRISQGGVSHSQVARAWLAVVMCTCRRLKQQAAVDH